MIDEGRRALVEAYLSGRLSDRECVDVERAAEEDAELAAYIESELSAPMETLRQSIQMPNLPDRALDRIRSIPRRRAALRWRWVGAVPLAAALGAFLLIPRSPTLRLVSAVGQVWVNGKQLRIGDSMPEGAQIICVNPARFSFGETTIPATSAMTVFSFANREGGPTFQVIAGELVFSESHMLASYQVAAGDWVASPLGTRFSASSDGGKQSNLSVYQAAVRLAHEGKTQVLTAGQAAVDGSPGSFIEDDPIGKLEEDVLVPTVNGLRMMSRIPYASISPDGARAISSALADPNPKAVQARIAVVLTKDELRAAASRALRLALVADPTLTSLSSSELWMLVRSQATAIGDSDRGDPSLAKACLMLLVARGEATGGYSGAWNSLLDLRIKQSEGVGDLNAPIIQSARNLLEFDDAADRLPIAEALQSAGQAPIDRHALAQAESMLKTLIQEKQGSSERRRFALLCHHLGETIYFEGRKRESVGWTKLAAENWPRPHWLVHAGGRIAETNSAPYSECLKWVQNGLRQDPSWPSFERALVAMDMYVLTPPQRAEELKFMTWIADRFSSVLGAQEELAEWAANTFDNLPLTEKLLQRCIALRGDVSKINSSTLITLGAFYHRHGDDVRSRQMAAPILEGSASEALMSYYRMIDEPARALAVMNRLEEKYEYVLLDQAQLENAIGKRDLARTHVTTFLGGQETFFARHGHHKDPLLVVEGLLLAADLAETDSQRKVYANGALSILELPSETSLVAQKNAQIFRAHALILLGKKQEALALLQELQGMALVPDKVKQMKELLISSRK